MAEATAKADIGIYGMGTMGSALALNMADNGFDVAIANRKPEVLNEVVEEGMGLKGALIPCPDLPDFVASLHSPRVILFMVPSGAPMDQMLGAIASLLDEGDTVIDGGNANFNDSRRRSAEMTEQGLHFVGMGVSGGEAGARHGPSIMVGGTPHSWTQLKPIVQAIAAKFEGDPCVDHLGPDGAGHFVKTVHNGIEYADMQMIAEIVGLMRDGLGMAPAEVGGVFADWDTGALKSYLVEITAKVLGYDDPKTGAPMVDSILDRAGQKGTGRWTVIEAIRMGQSATMIEAAVAGRAWSAEKETREVGEDILGGTRGALELDVDTLEQAFLAARVLDYAQGFRILQAASDEFDWSLDMARIAEIWRAGCIIRSALLDDIAAAFRSELPAGQLIFAPQFVTVLQDTVPALRKVVAACVQEGYAVPALASGLGWYDTMRQGRGTAYVLQAQRDFFGHHGFERVDEDGAHHGPWWA